MTEEVKPEEKIEETRKDDDMPTWADSIVKRFDALDARMDSIEKGRADSESKAKAEKEEVKADSETESKAKLEAEEHKAEKEVKADSEKEGKEAEEREDRARKDAQNMKVNRELQSKITEIQSRIDRVYTEPSFEDLNAIAEARARADSVYQGLTGHPASQPLPGELPIAYRKRLADGLRKFSSKFKDTGVDRLDGAVFEHVESQIYSDAQEAMRSPEAVPKGQIRSITRNDGGHTITEYMGNPADVWGPFMMGAAVTAKLTKPL